MFVLLMAELGLAIYIYVEKDKVRIKISLTFLVDVMSQINESHHDHINPCSFSKPIIYSCMYTLAARSYC